MCKLVTRSTPDWPCGGCSRCLSAFDCSLGVCRLHPSLQGPDDRSRLFGLSRLYNCPGWNEVHQNWRERQKQRQDCLFRWSRFHPKWWVVFPHVRHLCWSRHSDGTALLSSCAGVCSLSACSLYAHRITSEFFDPLFVAQKWGGKKIHIFTRIQKKIPELWMFAGMNWEPLCLSAGPVPFSASSAAPCSASPLQALLQEGLNDRNGTICALKPWSYCSLCVLPLYSHSQTNYVYRGAASHSHISHPRGQAKAMNQRPPPDYIDPSKMQHFDKNAYV